MPAWLPWVLAGGAELLNAIGSSKKQGEANDLQGKALEFAERDWNSRLPLREAFTQNSMRPIADAPNLSGIFADPGNPFASTSTAALPHVRSQLDLDLGRYGNGSGGGGGGAPFRPGFGGEPEVAGVLGSLPQYERERFGDDIAKQLREKQRIAQTILPGENQFTYAERMRKQGGQQVPNVPLTPVLPPPPPGGGGTAGMVPMPPTTPDARLAKLKLGRGVAV